MRIDLELARDALEAHPSPTLLATRDGRLLHANAAAVDRLGPSVRSFLEDEALLRICAAAADGQCLAQGVASIGSVRWNVAVAPVLLAGSGLPAALVIAPSPLAPEVDLEALAAGLAHEIRNPLAGLQGAAELMAAELSPDSPHRAYAELIGREARRVDGLVRSLLDLTRPPRLHPARQNVHEVCEDVARLASTGGPIERRYDPSLPELEFDRDAIAQVLHNLMRNAQQAMEGREGAVTIETAVATGTKVRVDGRARGLARISILDEGPGLPKELEIFTPFVTGRRAGTGLGLIIARRLVEAHGGRLELRDRKGGGAEAVVLLPLG